MSDARRMPRAPTHPARCLQSTLASRPLAFPGCYFRRALLSGRCCCAAGTHRVATMRCQAWARLDDAFSLRLGGMDRHEALWRRADTTAEASCHIALPTTRAGGASPSLDVRDGDRDVHLCSHGRRQWCEWRGRLWRLRLRSRRRVVAIPRILHAIERHCFDKLGERAV